MKKFLHITTLSLLMLSTNVLAKPTIELYKSPTCGCCSQWAAIMEKQGYEISVHQQNNWESIKAPFHMPNQLASCHTALIDGYMIEGHVPEADIARLLKERPADISGLAAPGMPRFSPGMAPEGHPYEGFNVVAFNKESKISLYKKY
jgi:hypothetical protein